MGKIYLSNMVVRSYNRCGSLFNDFSVLLMIKKTALILVVLFVFSPEMVEAQCAMCRAALESEADNSQAEGINNGIVYLMAIPYILVGGLFFVIYRKLKTKTT